MELSDITNQFIGNIKVTDLLKDSLQKELDNVVALISPHAGYYFSGKVAASGFNQINTYDNVFIIATSHKITFNGIAILDDTEYDGLSLNTDLITELEQNDLFFKNIDLFKDDHNLEIQLPFLKEKLPTTPIIPLMVGETNVDNLIKISETLKSKKYNFNIISCETKEGIQKLKEKIFKSFPIIRVYTRQPKKKEDKYPVILLPNSTLKDVAEKVLHGFSKQVKYAKITGPSCKFPNQKIGLKHVVKDRDVVEFYTD